jgi:dienelactone hydrolase
MRAQLNEEVIMKVLAEVSERGVTERRFDIEVGGEIVPGVVWAPEAARGARPVVLIGHGGTQHKRIDTILSLARTLVRHHGYAAVAIDAPGHGERISKEEAAAIREQRRAGPMQMTPEHRRELAARSGRAVADWKATLDAVEKLDYVGAGPVGYWGVSMGTMFGVPFVATEPRVKAAIFGLAGLRPDSEAFERAARSITIPLLFMFQLEDELMTPESGVALFKAFGSQIKSMHINPGPHVGIPAFERDYFETFYVRHLGSAKGQIA